MSSDEANTNELHSIASVAPIRLPPLRPFAKPPQMRFVPKPQRVHVNKQSFDGIISMQSKDFTLNTLHTIESRPSEHENEPPLKRKLPNFRKLIRKRYNRSVH